MGESEGEATMSDKFIFQLSSGNVVEIPYSEIRVGGAQPHESGATMVNIHVPTNYRSKPSEDDVREFAEKGQQALQEAIRENWALVPMSAMYPVVGRKEARDAV